MVRVPAVRIETLNERLLRAAVTCDGVSGECAAEFTEAGWRVFEDGEDGVSLVDGERDEGGFDVEAVLDRAGGRDRVGTPVGEEGGDEASGVFGLDGDSAEPDHARKRLARALDDRRLASQHFEFLEQRLAVVDLDDVADECRVVVCDAARASGIDPSLQLDYFVAKTGERGAHRPSGSSVRGVWAAVFMPAPSGRCGAGWRGTTPAVGTPIHLGCAAPLPAPQHPGITH